MFILNIFHKFVPNFHVIVYVVSYHNDKAFFSFYNKKFMMTFNRFAKQIHAQTKKVQLILNTFC